MLQETGDQGGSLLKEPRRDPFLGRAQAEYAEAVEPRRNRIATPVGEAFGGDQVQLIPRAFGADPRRDRIPEHVDCQLCDETSQIRLLRRVLDRVPWQRAPVADQVPEQSYLGLGHARLRRPVQATRKRDAGVGGQLVESAPAIDRQELVIRRRSDLVPKARSQRIDGLAARGEGVRHPAALELQGLGVDGADSEVARPTSSSMRR